MFNFIQYLFYKYVHNNSQVFRRIFSRILQESSHQKIISFNAIVWDICINIKADKITYVEELKPLLYNSQHIVGFGDSKNLLLWLYEEPRYMFIKAVIPFFTIEPILLLSLHLNEIPFHYTEKLWFQTNSNLTYLFISMSLPNSSWIVRISIWYSNSLMLSAERWSKQNHLSTATTRRNSKINKRMKNEINSTKKEDHR